MITDTSNDPLKEAKIYVTYGRNEQAVRVLEKAIQEHPSRNDLQDALSKIKQKSEKMESINFKERLVVFVLIMLGATLIFSARYLLILKNVGVVVIIISVIYALFCLSWRKLKALFGRHK